MTNRKKILKKITRGMGSTYLSFVIMFLCFLMTIMSFEFYELYSSTIRLQMFSDIVSDGATVYAKKPITVNETELDFMAKTLIEENETRGVINAIAPHQEISLTGLTVSNVEVREGAQDTLVTLTMENEVETVLGNFTRTLFASMFGWKHSVTTEVIALSTIPKEIEIRSADQAIFDAVLAKLSPGSKTHKALQKAIGYYGWGYSREHRWEEGARDCSSFIISSYEEMEIFNKTEDSYTQTMWRDGISEGKLKEVNSYPFDVSKLKIGDVIFFSTDWGVEEERENGIGSCAIYLGQHGGAHKIYLADEQVGRVCIGDLYGYSSREGRTNNKIVGYISFGGGGEWFDIAGNTLLKRPLQPGSWFLSSGYGPRPAGIANGSSTNHRGIDIAAPPGTKILAAADGVVTHAGPFAWWNGIYSGGYAVIINHDNGLQTRYMHGDRTSIVVSVGDEVVAGQVISHVGDTYKYGSSDYVGWFDGSRDTGISSGPHLHFELLHNGTHIDPAPAFGLPTGTQARGPFIVTTNPD